MATRESGCQLRVGIVTYCWMTHRRILMQVHLKCHGILGGKFCTLIWLISVSNQDRMLNFLYLIDSVVLLKIFTKRNISKKGFKYTSFSFMTTTFGMTCTFWSRDFGTGIVIILVSLTNIWNSFEGQCNVSQWLYVGALSSRLCSLRTRSQLSRARAPRVGLDFGWKFRQEAPSSGREETHACAQITSDSNRICEEPLITFVNQGFNAHISLIFHRTVLFLHFYTLSVNWHFQWIPFDKGWVINSLMIQRKRIKLSWITMHTTITPPTSAGQTDITRGAYLWPSVWLSNKYLECPLIPQYIQIKFGKTHPSDLNFVHTSGMHWIKALTIELNLKDRIISSHNFIKNNDSAQLRKSGAIHIWFINEF